MREFKFRIWNSFLEKLEEPTTWLPDYNEDGKDDWAKVMQYTGLKDKNGKEIYEGDIVVWHDTTENVDKGWDRYAVVNINPDLCFACFKVGDIPMDIKFHYGNFIWKETDKYFEIIGNIYENSELLNKNI